MIRALLGFLTLLLVMGIPQSCTLKKEPYPTIGKLVVLHPDFYSYVPKDSKIEVLAGGFDWIEGPVWWPKEAALVFSDVPQNIAYKWKDTHGVEEFLNPSGYFGNKENQSGSNGMTLDRNAQLVLCQSGNKTVSRFNAKTQTFDTLAYHFEGKTFNSPNDLVISADDHIYFTDPNYGMDASKKELDFQGVYRISPSGRASLLTKKWPTPNGIGLSPDEKTLYLSNSEPSKLIAYTLDGNGSISQERMLLDAEEMVRNSISKQGLDGMAIHSSGVIFLAGPDGVLLVTPKGKHLGTITTHQNTSNCTFNEDETVLYITNDATLLRVVL